jgi:hypothetical protein
MYVHQGFETRVPGAEHSARTDKETRPVCQTFIDCALLLQTLPTGPRILFLDSASCCVYNQDCRKYV